MRQYQDELFCVDCNVDMIEYYSKKYKGKRGKCPNCEMDFPLE